jgi:hypothetical protein
LIKVENGNPIPFEDEMWVENMALEKFVDAGIHRIAYISPENIFCSYETVEISGEDASGRAVKIKIFKQESDAVRWIESQQ